MHVELHLARCDAPRLGLAFDTRAACDAIEPFIAQFHETRADARLEQTAALRALLAAHFEDIRIVRGEADASVDVHRLAREIAHVNALVTHALPDELGAIDMQAAARQHHAGRPDRYRDW